MVIKGKSRGGAAALAAHLLRTDTNETVEVLEIAGVAAADLLEALREMEAVAKGARTTKAFYHASISPAPGYKLTAAQKARTVAALGEALKLTNQPRVVVEHIKNGRLHLHVVWSRIDLDRMAAIPDSQNYRRHEEVARALEREFGHGRVDGAHAEREGRPRPRRTASRAETQQSERTGINLKGVTADVTAAWKATRTGQAFVEVLQARGYIMARGDRRDYVVVDQAGGTHSLVRRVEGATAAQVRTRMADVDRDALPSVAEARAMQLPHQVKVRSVKPRRPAAAMAPRRAVTARRVSERHRKNVVTVASTAPTHDGTGEQPIVPAWYGSRAPGVVFNTAPVNTRSTARHDFQTVARLVCSSARRVMPLACKGKGGGEERLPRARHGRVARQRMVQQRRAHSRETAGPDGLVMGLMSAIATEVGTRSAAASAGIRADYARRMNEVCRSLPQEQVEGSLAALQGELDAQLTAVAEAAATEIRGRQEAVKLLHSGKSPDANGGDSSGDDMTAARPIFGFSAQPPRLAS